MRGLADLLSAILRLFQQWARLLTDLSAWEKTVQAQPARLHEVTGFGSNPGSLRMFAYVPDQLARSPALVVVLHGCLQTAAGYDFGAGWSTLADRYGFALLLPEQQTANNPQRCFNWFQREDSTRDQGEALSIRQMVEYMIRTHGLDRRRVFATGLSAGGAGCPSARSLRSPTAHPASGKPLQRSGPRRAASAVGYTRPSTS